jgi:predicted nuclease with TOPRIM domain
MKFQELECRIEVLVEENKSLLEKLNGKDMSKVQELECQIQFLEEGNKCLLEKLESKDAGMKTVQELESKIKVLEENCCFLLFPLTKIYFLLQEQQLYIQTLSILLHQFHQYHPTNFCFPFCN